MSFKAGVSVIDITPTLGLELCGYGFHLRRYAKGIHDPLHARILVLETSSREKYLYLNTELICLDENMVEKTRKIIQKETGIERKNIITSSTHTHSGPATTVLHGCGQIDKAYLSSLPNRFVQGTIKALKQMKNARIGFDETAVDISYNRAEKDGMVDPQVIIAKIETDEGSPSAVLFNYACHSVCLGKDNFLISSDFSGLASRIIEEKTGARAFFLPGACGDIDPKGGPQSTFQNVEKYGKILAEAVLKTLPEIRATDNVDVRLISRRIELPIVTDRETLMQQVERKINIALQEHKRVYQNWKNRLLKRLDKNPPSKISAEIQILSINNSVFFALPGEIFVKLGLEIKSKSPFDYSFIVGYANGIVGYIPHEDDFKRKGYASTTAPVIYGDFPFQPNVGKVLVNEVVKLLSKFEKKGEKYVKIGY